MVIPIPGELAGASLKLAVRLDRDELDPVHPRRNRRGLIDREGRGLVSIGNQPTKGEAEYYCRHDHAAIRRGPDETTTVPAAIQLWRGLPRRS